MQMLLNQNLGVGPAVCLNNPQGDSGHCRVGDPWSSGGECPAEARIRTFNEVGGGRRLFFSSLENLKGGSDSLRPQG